MQFKSITAIAVLLLLIATVLVAGCASSSNTTSSSNSPTPSLARGDLAADNLADAINDRFKALGYTVNTPFTMSKNNSTISYSGVITDGPKVITPYKRALTIMLVPGYRADGLTAYSSAVATAESKGYQKWISGNVTPIYWSGYLGTNYSSDPSTPRVTINLNEPMKAPLLLDAESNKEVMYNVDVGDYYQIRIDYQTAAST